MGAAGEWLGAVVPPIARREPSRSAYRERSANARVVQRGNGGGDSREERRKAAVAATAGRADDARDATRRRRRRATGAVGGDDREPPRRDSPISGWRFCGVLHGHRD